MHAPQIRCQRLVLVALAFSLMVGPDSRAAERVVLQAENWDDFVPQGKEVDCIYGDTVLRNDQIVAVVAQPISGRNANMTVRNVGGAVIDLTSRHVPNDQLSAYYPAGAETTLLPGDETLSTGDAVEYHCRSAVEPESPQMDVVYRIVDGEPWLHVETTYSNPHAEAVLFTVSDALRADRSFEFQIHTSHNVLVAADDWWHQAYAIAGRGRFPQAIGDSLQQGRPLLTWQQEESAEIRLEPGESYVFARQLIPAANTLQIQGLLRQREASVVHALRLEVRDQDGPVYNAKVQVYAGEELTGEGRTDHTGRLSASLLAGTYHVLVDALARPSIETDLVIEHDRDHTITLEPAGYVRGKIHDGDGRRIPCKVEFRGRDETPDPNFGPDTYIDTIENLIYSANGQFRHPVPPGQYDVIISHGPEFDAVFTEIDIHPGQETTLEAVLRRTVDTPGWISSDFHSHASPSGDNTSSQRGRVLNLLAEHLEFAPCTEHNRISTYVPHLAFFQAEPLMATCSGMELTGRPLPVNHQNAFPLKQVPRTQDGGGPTTDENPVVQIERLAFWDLRAQKVVQGNHPNLMQVLGDRDLDGSPDEGFERMLHAMDVVEVHPPQDILNFPTSPENPRERSNVIFHWLRLLNQGYRIPGVVNTDAHYNFHGSGWLRNYLQSPTDDPALITTADMVHAAKAGHVVMTNGPYLEVQAESWSGDALRRATAGDDLPSDEGDVELKVRVQCANWLDVNRVVLLLNGRPLPDHDYRRRTHPGMFTSGTVKFDHTLSLALDRDAHVIVVAAGEGLQLGPVVGPSQQETTPAAVANPIYVDVHADGFSPNGDDLGVPLPIATENEER